jgi:type III secretion protein L
MEIKIIKNSAAEQPEPGAGSGKIIKKELFEASQEARNIVDAARREAEQIVAKAQQERTASVEAGLQLGYEEGLKNWNRILAGAWQARENLKTEWEQSLLHLAIRVAEKIIGEQLRLHPDAMVSIVREALKSVGQERQLTLLIHPDHRETVQANLDRLQALVGSSRQIHLVANPDIAPGGCVVESELGVIDAKLETQLKCLEEILLSASKKPSSSA